MINDTNTIHLKKYALDSRFVLFCNDLVPININHSLYIMTSSNGTISALLSLFEGNPPGTGGFPHKGAVRRNFNVSFLYVWTNC